jgi:hypothetical protein
VPSTVAATVETIPISRDLTTADWIPGGAFQWIQLSTVNPSQT